VWLRVGNGARTVERDPISETVRDSRIRVGRM